MNDGQTIEQNSAPGAAGDLAVTGGARRVLRAFFRKNTVIASMIGLAAMFVLGTVGLFTGGPAMGADWIRAGSEVLGYYFAGVGLHATASEISS